MTAIPAATAKCLPRPPGADKPNPTVFRLRTKNIDSSVNVRFQVNNFTVTLWMSSGITSLRSEFPVRAVRRIKKSSGPTPRPVSGVQKISLSATIQELDAPDPGGNRFRVWKRFGN
jgi:hypothetical protein